MQRYIKITDIPPGPAPKWVRKEWMGLVLPIIGERTLVTNVGVSSGKAQTPGGYDVLFEDAMNALKKKSPRSVKWWFDNYPTKPASLVFRKEICRLVE